MFFFDDIPLKVSIVEGVEIGKVFSNKDSSSFINGVLDSIYNDLKNALETEQLMITTLYNIRGGFQTTCVEGTLD